MRCVEPLPDPDEDPSSVGQLPTHSTQGYTQYTVTFPTHTIQYSLIPTALNHCIVILTEIFYLFAPYTHLGPCYYLPDPTVGTGTLLYCYSIVQFITPVPF